MNSTISNMFRTVCNAPVYSAYVTTYYAAMLDYIVHGKYISMYIPRIYG